MNKPRRKQLGVLIDKLTALKPELEDLQAFRGKIESLAEDVSNLKDDLETLQTEEQESYDNLSDKAREGEKGETISDAISELEAAVGAVENLHDKLTEIVERFDEAEGEIDSATGSIDNARGEEL